MNRKQRVLTVIALFFFVLIGVLNMTSGHWAGPPDFQTYVRPDPPFVPWFMVGVIYAGLFFLLADKKDKR